MKERPFLGFNSGKYDLNEPGFLWPISHWQNALHCDRRLFQISRGRNHTKHKCIQAVTLAQEQFTTHGLPEKRTSDNRPPFQSQEFAEYMKLKGDTNHKLSPLWPQENSLAESFM